MKRVIGSLSLLILLFNTFLTPLTYAQEVIDEGSIDFSDEQIIEEQEEIIEEQEEIIEEQEEIVEEDGGNSEGESFTEEGNDLDEQEDNVDEIENSEDGEKTIVDDENFGDENNENTENNENDGDSASDDNQEEGNNEFNQEYGDDNSSDIVENKDESNDSENTNVGNNSDSENNGGNTSQANSGNQGLQKSEKENETENQSGNLSLSGVLILSGNHFLSGSLDLSGDIILSGTNQTGALDVEDEQDKSFLDTITDAINEFINTITYFFIEDDGDYIQLTENKGIDSIMLQDPESGEIITIMDRNLGAEENDITSSDSYGYYYQWGNNNGITGVDENNISGIPAIYSKKYSGIGYTRDDKFRVGNNDIWEEDEEGRSSFDELWYLGDDEEIQGPCPNGYHIPTVKEWNKLLITWSKIHTQQKSEENGNTTIRIKEDIGDDGELSGSIISITNVLDNCGEKDFNNSGNCIAGTDLQEIKEQFLEELKLSYAGNYRDATYNEGIGVYWTSTPSFINSYQSEVFNIDKYFGGEEENEEYKNRATGNPLRCFLNNKLSTYNDEEIVGEVTNNGVTVKVSAPVGSFYYGTELKIEPIRWWSIGSIKDQLIEEKEEITEDSTVVAFDISFLYSGEEVQPLSGNTISVTFNYENNEDLKQAEEDKKQEVKVYHINDKDGDGNTVENKEIENIDIVENKEGELVFEAENFSIYAVSSTSPIQLMSSIEGVIINYNPNGGYWSGGDDKYFGEKVITYTKNEDGKYEANLNLQFPNKLSDGNTNYMFAGWYLESGDSINQINEWYTQDDELEAVGEGNEKTVYAKWLPFEDLPIVVGGKVVATIMDRNLGAEDIATGIGSGNNGQHEDYTKLGYHYQWGNNYGFPNSGNLQYVDDIRIDGDSFGPNNYYSNSTYKDIHSPKRYTINNNLNLWGGESGENSDTDKQGPCPVGYHVPDNGEWMALYNTFVKEKSLNDEFCGEFTVGNIGRCLTSKLKLPFGNGRGGLNNNAWNPGTNAIYRTSSPVVGSEEDSYTFYLLGYETSYTNDNIIYGFERTRGYPVRCFKNSEASKLTILPENDIDENESFMFRWRDLIDTAYEPQITKKKGYRFMGWYDGDSEFEFGNSYISEDTQIMAKWEKNPWYIFDANGGSFGSGMATKTLKYEYRPQKIISKTPNVDDNGESFESYPDDLLLTDVIKIDGAENLHVKIIYGGESHYDYVVMWKGAHEDYGTDYYEVANHVEDSITSILSEDEGEPGIWEGDVEGDTVTIIFVSDGSYYDNPYGYYAVVSEKGADKDYKYVTEDVVSTPSREGYTFNGWYTIENGVEVDFDQENDEVTEDKTIYAKWGGNNNTVLLPGQEFNKKIKSISKGIPITSLDVEENNIISIERYEGDSPNLSNAQEIQESGNPVYAWLDNGVLYYYSNADEIYINPDATKMFFKFKSLTGFDFTQFETSLITGMESMFQYDANLESINMSGIDLRNVETVTNIFNSCTNLKEVDMQSILFGKLLSLSEIFKDRNLLEKVDLTNADLGNVTNLYNMFMNANSLKEVLFENLKASNVTNISGIFGNCRDLQSVNMKNADFRSLGNIAYIFDSKKKIKEIDMSNMNLSGATNLSYMFNQCTGLELINMENIDARSVTNIQGMFNGTSNLKKINMSKADFSSLTSLQNFIKDHKAIEEIDMSGMNISKVTTMAYMFYNDANLKKINLTNADVGNLITTEYMFSKCISITGINLNFKNTDKIENMNHMFYGATGLVDINISEMTLNNVNNMNNFLRDCTSLTGVDFSGLTINSGNNMSEFFRGCTNLKKVNLSNAHLNNVQDMTYFFFDCYALEEINMSNMVASGVKNIGSMFTNTKSLKKVDMSNVDFRSVGTYQNSLGQYVGGMQQLFQNNTSVEEINMSGMNISGATVMNHIFNGCTNLKDVNLTNINARNVTNIGSMFLTTPSLKKVNMSYADFRRVESIKQLFQENKSIEEINLEGANFNGTKNMDYVFDKASNLKKVNFTNFDASNATTMEYMFRNCSSLTGITLNFKSISNLTTMAYMFEGAGIQSIDLSKLPTNRINNMKYFLSKCPNLTGVNFSGLHISSLSGVNIEHFFEGSTGLKKVDMSNVYFENINSMDHLFNNCTNLEEVNMSNMTSRDTTNIWLMFAGTTSLKKVDMSNADLRGVLNMAQLFQNNTSVEEINMSGLNISGATQMNHIFNGCTNLKNINLSNVNARNLTNISLMFLNTPSLKKVDMSNADLRSVSNMEQLFIGNTSIEEINMEGMNLSGLTRMDYILKGCSNLKKANLANINTENLKQVNNAFAGCSGLVLVNLSGFVTDAVTNMNNMFDGCSNLKTLDLSTLNFEGIPSMEYMFNNNTNLKTIYAGESFNPDNIASSTNMFNGAISLIGGNGTEYDSTKINKAYAKIDDENNIGYFTNKNHFALNFVNPSGRTLGKQWKSVGTTGVKLNDGDVAIQYYTDSTQQTIFDFQEPLSHYTKVYTIGDNIVYQINFYNNDNRTIFSGIMSPAGEYLPMKRYYTHPDIGTKSWFDGWYTSSGDFSIKNRFEFDKENIEDNINLYPHRLEYNDVTYFDAENPEEIVTYMDRNLGATTNDVNNTGSYGYHYQWGNSHGFSRVKNKSRDFELKSKEDTTNEKFIGLVDFGSDNPFYKSSFYYASQQSDWANPGNDDMYGGSGDSASNLWGLSDENKTNRQGLCPNGYHVPSVGELDKLIDLWIKNKYGKSELSEGILQNRKFTDGITVEEFKEELLIPLAGYRYDQDGLVSRLGESGRYLSSTPMKGLTIGDATDTYQTLRKTLGQSIRCFKNQPADITTHSVSFESNGGDMLRTLYARHGKSLLKKPLNPTKPNSIFSGWYTNSQLTQKFNLDSTISSDITLYAKRDCATGSHLSDDGEYCIKDGEQYQRIAITGINNEIIQVNHQTWNDLTVTYGDKKVTIMDRNLGATKSGTNNPLSDGSNFEINGYYYQWGNNYGFPGPKDLLQETTTQPVETIGYGPNNYYANNVINNSTWDQSYNQNLWGGLSGTDESMQGPCPDGYHIPRQSEMIKLHSLRCAEEMNNENCSSGVVFFSGLNMPFAGWKSSTDMRVINNGSLGYYWESQRASLQQGSRLKVQSNNIEPNSKDVIKDGYSIRCFKNTNPKIITYQLNSGNNNQNNPTKTSSWWEEGTPLLSGTRNGYVFKGWYTTSGFDTESQVTTNNIGQNVDSENVTLYANWEPNKYTITYNANGGEGEDIIDELIYDSDYNIINNPYRRSGYIFSGWNTQSDGNGQSYEEGFSGVLNVTENITLYAEWIGCLTYEVIEGTDNLRITGLMGDESCKENLIIPNKIDDKWVTEIGNNAFYNKGLTGTLTFQEPSHLIKIGHEAFYQIKSLEGVLNIPVSVTEICGDAFAQAFNKDTQNYLTGGEGITTLGGYAFGGNNFRGGLKIPNGLTEISSQYRDNAFTGIDFNGAQITKIGTEAFYQMRTLEGILDIPASVTEIGSDAFAQAFNKDTQNYLTGGEGITTLGNYAFEGNNFRGGLKIPNGLTEISSQYRDNAFTGIDFNGAQITKIGTEAFYQMRTLEGILDIPASVTEIGSDAFAQAFNKDTQNYLTGGEGITTLGNYAFGGNNFRGGLKIPNGLTEISSQYRDNAFTGIDFNGAQITKIGTEAFYQMRTLEGTLDIPASVTEIGSDAFAQAFNKDTQNYLTGGEGITTLGNYAFGGNNFRGVLRIPNGLTELNIQYKDNSFTWIDFSNANNLQTIGREAFEHTKTIQGSLEIPTSVTNIYDYSFNDNKLSSVNFLSGATVSVYASAFCNNSGVVQGYSNGADVTVVNPDESCFQLNDKLVLNVSFDSQIPGSGINILQVNYNEYATKPEGEIISGDSVLKWYLTGATKEFDFKNTPIKSDITLYGGRDEYGVENVCYNISKKGDGTVIIKGFKTGAPDECKINPIIPNRILNEGWVSEIGYEAFLNKGLSGTLTFLEPSHITTIGGNAFQNNNFVGILRIPSSLTVLSNSFRGLHFTGIDLREATSLTEISTGAFGGYWDSEHFYTFEGELFIPKTVQKIGQHAFNSAFSGKTENRIIFEEGSQLTSIGVNALYNNNFKGLLKIPGNLIVLGDVFRGNPFTGIDLTEAKSLKEIGDNAFGSYNNQYYFFEGELFIPKSVQKIGGYAFYGAFSGNTENSLVFEEGSQLTTIGDRGLQKNNFKGVLKIPSNLTYLGSQFYGNSFTGIDLREAKSLTEIGASAFGGYQIREHFYTFEGELFIPKTVQKIGQHAFNGAFSGKTENRIIFEEGSQLTSIGSSAFEGDNFQGTIFLPSSITAIGGFAFRTNTGTYYTTGYTIDIKEDINYNAAYLKPITKLYTYTFVNTGGDTLGIGYYQSGIVSDMSKLIPIEYYTDGVEPTIDINSLLGEVPEGYVAKWQGLPKNSIATGNLIITGEVVDPSCKFKTSNASYNGVQGVKIDGFLGTVYDECLNNFSIPETINNKPVFEIGWDAFKGNGKIRGDLVIPDSVKSIKWHAFDEAFTGDNNKLKLPEGLIEIQDSAFRNNNFTGNLKLPESLSSLGMSAFQGNKFNGNLIITPLISNIGYATFKNNRFTKIDFSRADSLTKIDNESFQGMGTVMGELIIPDSVTTIGSDAFRGTFTGYNNRIKLGKKLTNIATSAFNGDNFQGSIFIPDSITGLGWGVFKTNTGTTYTTGYTTDVKNIDYEYAYIKPIIKLYTYTFVNTGGEILGTGYYQSGVVSDMTKRIPIEYYTDGGNIEEYPEISSGIIIPEGKGLIWNPKLPVDSIAKENLILTATIINKYTVSFETFNAGEIPSQGIVSGETIVNPGVPEIFEGTNYIFSGWYLSGLNTEFDFNTPISEDITLYAKWNCEEGYRDNGEKCATIPTLLQGQQLNGILKTLGKGETVVGGFTSDSTIEHFEKYEGEIPEGVDKRLISTSEETPVYAWYSGDNKTLYYHTLAPKVFLNNNSSHIFNGLNKLKSLDMTFFDSSRAVSMDWIFGNCSSLTEINLSNFNTSSVTNIGAMFNGCSSLTGLDVSKFNTSNVTTMVSMFNGCSSLVLLDVSKFNTSNVTNMESMFAGCSSLTGLDVSKFNTSNVTNMRSMFNGCSSLTGLDVSKFNTNNVTNMSLMFNGCKSLIGIDVRSFNTTNVTNMESMFNGCSSLTGLDVSKFNTSSVTTMRSMFNGCKSLIGIDVRSFNTTNVTNMESMFNGCSSLTGLDVSKFNTSSVTNMRSMFNGCSSLTGLDVSKFNTSNVANMSSMFNGCSSLTGLDVRSFNTTNVTNMESMFNGCSSLTGLDVSKFNTSSVTNMRSMFNGCSSLTGLDVSKFNTSNVTNMQAMFNGCSSLTGLDVSSFDTSNVTSIINMFSSCNNLKTIYASDSFTNNLSQNSWGVFSNSTSLVGGNGTKYNNQKTNAEYARIDSGDIKGYFTDPRAFTVRFLSGTETISTQTISTGGYATGIIDNTRIYSYYTDYTDPEINTPYVFTTPLYTYTEIYVTSIPAIYTVTYDAESHSGTISNQPKKVVEENYNTTIQLTGELSETAISQKEGYQFMGWTTELGGINPITEYTVVSDVTFYPIFKKDIVEYTALFSGNGSTLIGDNQTGCVIPVVYNTGDQPTSCNIITPSIQRVGYDVLGFDESQNHEDSCSITGNQEIGIDSNKTYYAITKKELTAIFDKNENDAQKKAGEQEITDHVITEKCTLWNEDTECSITTPEIINATKNIIGYSRDAINSGDRVVNHSTEIQISETPISYFAWSKSTPVTYNVIFTGGYGIQSISKESESCTTNVKYNGEENETGCKVEVPTITMKYGYKDAAWYSGNMAIEVDNNNKTFIDENKTLTAKAQLMPFTINVESIDENKGTVEGSGIYEYYTSATIKAIANSGYAFSGWLLNGELVSTDEEYEFRVEGPRTYEAIWKPRTDTVYRVEIYEQEDGAYPETPTRVIRRTGTTDDIAEIENSDKIKEGYLYDESQNNIESTRILPNGDGVLKIYLKKLYEVRFSANTASGSINNTVLVVDYGTEITENDNVISVGTENITATPNERTDKYTHTFSGWSTTCNTNGINESCEITAQFISTINKYKITFVDEDGVTSLWSGDFEYETTPIYGGTEPTKSWTPQYTYEFSGWNPKISTVYGEKTYTAIYRSILNTYTVTWKNSTGTVLEVDENVPYGDMSNYNGAIPTSGKNAQYTYEFSGWIPSTGIVVEDIIYTASYKSIRNEYPITWIDGNRKELKTDILPYEALPNYEGDTPTKTRTAQYTYTFNNTWLPKIESVKTGATYIAQFDSEVNQYQVNIFSNDEGMGTVDDENLLVDYGTEITENSNVITIGTEDITAIPNQKNAQYTYIFDSWLNNCGDSVKTGCTITANFDKYTNSYLVTFNSNGGTTITNQIIKYGEKVSEPANPTRVGYNFRNWYYNGVIYAFESTITTGFELDAEWNVISYSIDYNLNGGTNNVNNPENYTVESGDIQLREPTREGYTFQGWRGTDIDGVSKDVIITGGSIGDRTFEAIWDANTYQIQYHSNNGENKTEIQEFEYDKEEALSKNSFEKTGYTFTQWNTEVEGTGISYDDEEIIENVATSGVIDLYAQWIANNYMIRYHANQGSGEDEIQNFVYDEEQALRGEIYSRTGYNFLGWNTLANGEGINYTTGQIVKNLATIGNVDLYAQWGAKKYTITYVANLGEGEDVANEVYYDANYTINNNMFKRTGYTFSGWNTKANGEGQSFEGGYHGIWKTTNNVTLYAIWNVNYYTVIYDAGTHSGVINNQSIKEVSKQYKSHIPLTGNDSETATSEKGYTFIGWTTEQNGTGVIDEYELTGDITFYPVFKKNPVEKEIVFYLNGNSGFKYNEESYYENKSFNLCTIPARYNTDNEGDCSAEIELGDIIASDNTPNISGWSTTEVRGEETNYEVGRRLNITVKEDTITKFYTQTYSLPIYHTIYFEYGTGVIDVATTSSTCKIPGTINGVAQSGSCNILLPLLTAKTGYINPYWYKKGTEEYITTPTIAISHSSDVLEAIAQPRGDIKYVIKHYFQMLNNDGTGLSNNYVLNDDFTFNGEGTGDSVINLETQKLGSIPEGFHYWKGKVNNTDIQDNIVNLSDYTDDDYDAQTTIDPEGRLVIKLFYKRNLYTITWMNGNTELGKTLNLPYGVVPVYSGSTPTKSQTPEFTYEFANSWTPELYAANSDETYYANYNAIKRSYVITWIDEDDSLLKTTTVLYGDTPEYPLETPKKASDSQYHYIFDSWTPEIIPVNGTATYKAQYSSQLRKYLITWKDGDGKVIQSGYYDYGTTPEYEGENPTKTSTAQTGYTFNGAWNPPVIFVQTGATYTAQFNAYTRKYPVIWLNENDGLIKESEEYYGTNLNTIKPNNPEKDSTVDYDYTFDGWYTGNSMLSESSTVQGITIYKARFNAQLRSYPIWFKNYNGEVLQSGLVLYGTLPEYTGTQVPSKPRTQEYSFKFNGWTPGLTEVVGETVYTASYESIKNKYLIQYLNEDGSVLWSGNVEYGNEVPSYNGTPNKQPTIQTGYTFIKWIPVPTGTVTGPQDYTATYSEYLRSYELKSIIGKGIDHVEGIGKYEYGTDVILTGIAKIGYHFGTGLSYTTTGVTVVGDMTIKFNAKPNHYIVQYLPGEGTGVMEEQEFEYDKKGTINPNTFIKTGYNFAGWKDTIGNYYNDKQEVLNLAVTGMVVFEAQWDKVEEQVIPIQQSAAGGGRRIERESSIKEQEHNVADEKENINQNENDNSTNLSPEEREVLSAYEWAYKHNITTLPTLERANPEGKVKRGHLAKMIVNYATNVLGREIPEKIPNECRWNDRKTDRESEEIKDYAVKSCALGLMGLDMDKFLPNMEVTRAQFGTIMSRLLWGKKYAGGTPYYRKHLNALKENNIMTQIENPEKRVELRQWVWLMLMRSAENK